MLGDLTSVAASLRQAVDSAGAAQRTQEIAALQARVLKLESLLASDADVIRRLCALLVKKKLATRDEVVDLLK